MCKKTSINPILVAVSLACFAANSGAQLSTSKAKVNSVANDNVTAMVSFPTPVTGDLYLATEINGQLHFLGQNASLSKSKMAYQSNSLFSNPITVLNIASAGITPGVYPLYQVVTLPGADPMFSSNWLGGEAGLSKLEFSINLTNTLPAQVSPAPTPEVVNTPIIEQPIAQPVSNAADGASLYISKGCANASCHGPNPAENRHDIIDEGGKTLGGIKTAIKRFSKEMGYLGNPNDPRYATDTELRAIAEYVSGFN